MRIAIALLTMLATVALLIHGSPAADPRLKASFDTSRFPPQSRVILECLKTYGMLLADNGTDWFISGAPDARWDDEELNALKTVRGEWLEVVKMGPIVTR